MTDAALTLRFIDFGWPLVSPMIQWWTQSWVTHVDIIHDGLMISAYPNGVEWRRVEDFPAVREEMISIACTVQQMNAVLGFASAQVGKPYDYLGPLSRAGTDRWFCSALVAAALHEGRITAFPRPQAVSPADIHRRALDLVLPAQGR
jgi:uncharacterized protein YycO